MAAAPALEQGQAEQNEGGAHIAGLGRDRAAATLDAVQSPGAERSRVFGPASAHVNEAEGTRITTPSAGVVVLLQRTVPRRNQRVPDADERIAGVAVLRLRYATAFSGHKV